MHTSKNDCYLSYLKMLAEAGGFQLCRLLRKIPGDAKKHHESISFSNEVKQKFWIRW